MKIISDIRLYRSTVANVDGNGTPESFCCRQINIVLHRIVMKLREQGFSLGEFDHLYINFSTCVQAGQMRPAERSVDPYHKWFRYYDIGVSQQQYDRLGEENSQVFILDCLQQLLISFFAAENTCCIEDCISQAVEQGEKMLMLYKTKQAAKVKAAVYLQYLNSGRYQPHLFVWDLNGQELLHKRLKESTDLQEFGEIGLSSKKVTVKPRKNSLTGHLSPVSFELP